MTGPPSPDACAGEAFLADLLDRFLEEIQEGGGTALEEVLADRPDLEDRIRETYRLAREIAPRRPLAPARFEGYTILRELGRGGMSTVYLARQESLGRLVALKVLSPALGLSEPAKRRFLQEARTLASLKDDRIVRIHEVLWSGEFLAYAMEWVEGVTLRQVIDDLKEAGPHATSADLARSLGAQAGKLGAASLVHFLVQAGLTVARALAEVHAAGLVHRDVKPSNILIRRDGSVLLADFGLARGSGSSPTRTGGFAGTPVYASPEQLEGARELDGRSDVYSLGVALYEALARRLPFRDESPPRLRGRIERGESQPLRKAAPWAPRDLETILARAMEPDPARRYGSAAELADDLERLLRFQPIRARPAGWMRRGGKLLRRHRTPLLAAASGALVVAAALIPFLGGTEGGPDVRRRVAELVRAARLELVGPDAFRRAWFQLALGRKKEQAGIAVRKSGIQTALALYERALRLAPSDTELQWEGEVVALANEIGNSAYLSIQHRAARLATLCPLAAKAVQGTHGDLKDLGAVEIASAPLRDQKALGLLAFLTGNVVLCERAWAPLDPVGLAFPLVDAGLGILYLADNRPSRASDRLLTAVEAFPESSFLTLELAHAALEKEDPDLAVAERWQARGAAGASEDPRLQELLALVRGDMFRLKGDLAGACREYMRIGAMEEMIPMARLRLAQVALLLGEPELGRRRLGDLVNDWPEVAAFRRVLVEASLQAGDLEESLVQVRHVLREDFGMGRSPGTTRDLLWILGACGLKGLLDKGLAYTRAGQAPPLMDYPAFPGPFSSRERMEELLERLAGFERDGNRGLRVPPMDAPDRGLAETLSFLVRLGTYFPEALAMVSPLAFPGAWAGGFWIRGNWERACESIQGLVEAVRCLEGTFRLQEPLHVFRGDPGNPRGDRFGISVSGIGDINGDGCDDILVGAPYGNSGSRPEPLNTGLAYVFSGRDGRTLWTLKGRGPKDQFGFSASGTGDVDGDGCPDLLVSAKGTVWGGKPGVGSVILFSGKTGERIREFPGDPNAPHGYFGFSVACAGDVDGDGIPDIIGGANAANDNTGYVLVLSGRDGRQIWRFDGKAKGDWFGQIVDGAGDVNRDGSAEVIVGAGQFKTSMAGYAEVYSGKTGRALYSLYGKSAGDLFYVVAGAGDLNEDGISDFMIGSPGENEKRGMVRVYSGSTGETIHEFHGMTVEDRFGFNLRSAGDVDGDGVPDIIAGASQASIQGKGYARVHSGSTGARLLFIAGPEPKSWFAAGYPGVNGAGDVNGDGYADVVIGANQWYPNAKINGPGFVMVFSGRPAGATKLKKGVVEKK